MLGASECGKHLDRLCDCAPPLLVRLFEVVVVALDSVAELVTPRRELYTLEAVPVFEGGHLGVVGVELERQQVDKARGEADRQEAARRQRDEEEALEVKLEHAEAQGGRGLGEHEGAARSMAALPQLIDDACMCMCMCVYACACMCMCVHARACMCMHVYLPQLIDDALDVGMGGDFHVVEDVDLSKSASQYVGTQVGE